MNTHILPDEFTGSGSKPAHLGRVYGCAVATAVTELAAEGCTLAVVDTVAAAETLEQQLGFFAPAGMRVALMPDTEALPYDRFSPHPDLTSRRLRTLADIAAGNVDLIIVAAQTLAWRLPPRSHLTGASLALRAGQALDIHDLRDQLEGAGFQRVSQVYNHGEYAVRGSLLDVFPMGSELPIRLDFFDATLETLRTFDPDTQRTREPLTEFIALPPREFPLDADGIKQFRQNFRARFNGTPGDYDVYREISERRVPGGIESYLPLFFESTCSLWDYLPSPIRVICIGDTRTALESNASEVAERHESYRHDISWPLLDPEELFFDPENILAAIAERQPVHLASKELTGADDVHNLALAAAPRALIQTHAPEPIERLLAEINRNTQRTLLAVDTAGRRELLKDMLRDNRREVTLVESWAEFQAGDTPLALTVAPLGEGYITGDGRYGIFGEQDLFGDRKRSRRKRRVRDPDAIVNDLTDLNAGAAVVHDDYGVGRFVGLTLLDIDGMTNEFLTLEYAGGDKLHVPVSSLHLISRFTGLNPETAPLHRLGTDQWQKARKKAAEQVRDTAAELLELYARRASRTGQQYQPSVAEYEQFATGFQFELTDDQAGAIDAVLADLSSDQPMDRLICGDVGFGKTEVALRAAFAVASTGRQVVVLVPTTLLAQQHYQNFCDRFADWPITVEQLSRFRSGKETTAALQALRTGAADIVIGTHKLLGRDIEFKDLGLVIVDEEHRFGVRHKERLKELRSEVDILTLTATPIPRTLNMAMGGIRDLSLITTPPQTRLSIKTFVTEWDKQIIQEACQRELKRGGQVYFVHNRVRDIQEIAEKVADIVPDASIQVAHGQMRERELERIMDDFYHRRFHILVCTSIVESGIDVPNANTIIINRADHFGLAQLHQLRGRVGRSHHKAFAYLLAPPEQALTDDAAKRLAAIESMEDLGAGFVLATHDLEIRGAGELLGEEQSGQMQQIGFSLYLDMLNMAVESLRAGEEPELDAAGRGQAPEVNLRLPALLPDDYVPDVHLRLVLYKRIASCADDAELADMRAELADRFGPLPPATVNLFRMTRIKQKAQPLGIRRIESYGSGGHVEFGPGTGVDPTRLVSLLQSHGNTYKLDNQQRLRFSASLQEPDSRFSFIEDLIAELTSEPAKTEKH